MPKKAKAILVFSGNGIKAKLFVGQTVTENWGPKIGKVVSAKARRDGMVECVCTIDDEKFVRMVHILDEEQKKRLALRKKLA